MSMFRIAMNDGWTEVMYSAMNEVYKINIAFACLTALFFIFFHLLTNSVSSKTLLERRRRDRDRFDNCFSLFVQIVLSLFVAAILDNLEFNEDAKMIKQVCLSFYFFIKF
jgi:undecaprenyl pyrophosphate phosphatase UppP